MHRDAGGAYLFCDTDSAAIVSAEQQPEDRVPDGRPPITALSWGEVQEIVDKFGKLNPYDPQVFQSENSQI